MPLTLSKSDYETAWPTPYGWEPKQEWFQPDMDLPLSSSPIITPEGRFTAWSHDWKTAHIGTTQAGTNRGWIPKPSKTGNRAYNFGTVHTAEGTELLAGVIPLEGGHASASASVEQAQKHYAHPERVRVWGTANETEKGCQINGTIIPGTTHAEVAQMRMLGLSGDWRYFPNINDLDYIGPCFVARRGLPIGTDEELMAVAASADHSMALFEDEIVYEQHQNEEGRIICVTASVNTVKINPTIMERTMNLKDLHTNAHPITVTTTTTTNGIVTASGETQQAAPAPAVAPAPAAVPVQQAMAPEDGAAVALPADVEQQVIEEADKLMEQEARIQKVEAELEQLQILYQELASANETIEEVMDEVPES